MSRRRALTVEGVADVDIHKMIRDRWPQGDPPEPCRTTGSFRLRWAIPLRWRAALHPGEGTGELHLQAGAANEWTHLSLVRHPTSGRWQARCPECLACCGDLYFLPSEGSRGACRECHRLAYARLQFQTHGSREMRHQLRAGGEGRRELALALASPGPRAIDALKALEDEELLPRRITLAPKWERRRRRA